MIFPQSVSCRDLADRAARERGRLRFQPCIRCRLERDRLSAGVPTISQREAETSATVRDGDSFVIGGLTQEDVINNKTKIPLLGDIPIVGQAFRTDKRSSSKTELYILVTPHIVHRAGATQYSASGPVTIQTGPHGIITQPK